MTVWLRADGSATSGFGHVMRTIPVAEQSVTSGEAAVCVIGGDPASATLTRRRLLDTRPPDVGWLNDVAPGDVVVFDGYHFGPDDFSAAAARGAVVGAIDDHAEGTFEVDVVLNQNLPDGHQYVTGPTTELLIGPRYALVRDEFRGRRRLRPGPARRLLLTFGASDVVGLGRRVVDLLGPSRGVDHVTLVIGTASPDLTDPPPWLTIVRDPPDLASVFDETDIAVSAAGSTTWELLCMGIPTALVQVVDNQRHVAAPVAAAGAALDVGGTEALDTSLPAVLDRLADPDECRRLSERALDLVDGGGAERFLAALLSRR